MCLGTFLGEQYSMSLLAHKNKIKYNIDLWVDIPIGISQKLLDLIGKLIRISTYSILVDPIRASAALISIGIAITVPFRLEVNICFIISTRLIYQDRLFYEKDGKVKQTFREVLADRSFFLKLRRDSPRKGGVKKGNVYSNIF